MKPLLTTEEIADYLRLEVVTVRRLAQRGELPAYRIGGEFRFIGEDIEEFVRNQRVQRINADPFGKFTQSARNVMILANEQAEQLNHHFIGTEHLLLGMLDDSRSVAFETLQRTELDLEKVRQSCLALCSSESVQVNDSPAVQLKAALQDLLGKGRPAHTGESRAMTRRVRKVIELAVEEARGLKHDFVGSEHLLLGILREGDGLAAKVLIGEYALQVDAVRNLILQILQENATVAAPDAPEQALTLLATNEAGIVCANCSTRCPEYFRYCFQCGLKLS